MPRDPADQIEEILHDGKDALSRIATVLGMDEVEKQRDTLAGLLKRCAVLLPEKHPARKAAVAYLKEHRYFNVLRNQIAAATVALEHIEVECLTDESGTAYCVRVDIGRNVVRSKWMRKASAEKLGRTLRDAYGVQQPDGSQHGA